MAEKLFVMFFKKRKIYKLSRFNKKIYFYNLQVYYYDCFLIFNRNNIFFKLFLISNINVLVKKNSIYLYTLKFNKKNLSLIGTYNSIIKNIILGYDNNFCKKLLLVGVGYKAYLINRILYLYLGFSHPVLYKIPDGIFLKVISFNEIHITGVDKQKVFQVSSIIRNLKKPDPYKGKGIRYLNEVLNFKEVKKK